MPETEHNDELHRVRQEIAPYIGEIIDALHEANVIKRDEEWRIPFVTSCGFKGTIVIEVNDTGNCLSQRRSTNGHH